MGTLAHATQAVKGAFPQPLLPGVALLRSLQAGAAWVRWKEGKRRSSKGSGKGGGKGKGNDSGKGRSKGRGQGQDKGQGGQGGGGNRQPDNKNKDKNGGNPNPNPGGNSEPSGGQSGPTTRSQTQAQQEQGAKREHEGGEDGNAKRRSRFMRTARKLRNKGFEVTRPAEF